MRLFAFDSVGELEKVARAAPGSRVFCRILTSGEGADWPLSRKFGGLAETMEEAIRYPIVSARSGPTGPVILAGPTCDSADVLYERSRFDLPLELAIGDRLEIRSAGAYTATYATVGFNGFEPLRTFYI